MKNNPELEIALDLMEEDQSFHIIQPILDYIAAGEKLDVCSDVVRAHINKCSHCKQTLELTLELIGNEKHSAYKLLENPL